MPTPSQLAAMHASKGKVVATKSVAVADLKNQPGKATLKRVGHLAEPAKMIAQRNAAAKHNAKIAQKVLAARPIIKAVHGLGAIPFASRVPPGSVRTLPDTSPYPPGREGFFRWLKASVPPKVYKAFLAKANGLSGLGDDSSTADPSLTDTSFMNTVSVDSGSGDTGNVSSGMSSWADALKTIIPAVASSVTQQRVLSAQLDRAKHGYPPLNVSAYTGDVGAKVGVDTSTQNTLLIGAGILGAALLIPALLKK